MYKRQTWWDTGRGREERDRDRVRLNLANKKESEKGIEEETEGERD